MKSILLASFASLASLALNRLGSGSSSPGPSAAGGGRSPTPVPRFLSVLAAVALAAALTGCANVNTEYAEYSPDGKVLLKHYTRTDTGFNPAWSSGDGKTIDVHPEVSGLSL